ncbi:hypothetical protein HDV05_007686 [Chytridiales sp. JEL 0842]|nr:hypothetical protein HDV05_007686 [Chytridiales sp. JEL 0842]
MGMGDNSNSAASGGGTGGNAPNQQKGSRSGGAKDDGSKGSKLANAGNGRANPAKAAVAATGGDGRNSNGKRANQGKEGGNAKARRKRDRYSTSARYSRTINVEEFMETRSFEINAMESALKNATEFTGSMRVFQTLPRHMRRRAASYNVKRLPQKYRQRAIYQMKDNGNEPQKKSRKAKRRPGAIMKICNKRSKEGKKWLETHLWHAKRMHMDNLWGYQIALHPNDKSKRASYRASKNQCIMHDKSYNECFELHGTAEHIISLMSAITDPTVANVGHSRFISGGSQGSSFLHRPNQYPKGAIAPITFFWRRASEDPTTLKRTMWVWIHPSALKEAKEVFEEISSQHNVEVILLQNDLARFELTGPRTHALLQETLHLHSTSNLKSKQGSKVWEDLKYLRTPASLPPGVIISLYIQDPRLSFPTNISKRLESVSEEANKKIHQIMMQWPADTHTSDIWEKSYRSDLAEKMPKDAAINKEKARRSSVAAGIQANEREEELHQIKGEYTAESMQIDSSADANHADGAASDSIAKKVASKPTKTVSFADQAIPILLVQRDACSVQPLKGNREYTAGWDIILPSVYAVPLWKLLNFAGARVAGIEDVRSFHFESGVASFPHDFPETRAFVDWTTRIKQQEQSIWDKRPKAKRINYDKLGVKHPFQSLFHKLLPDGNNGVTMPVPTRGVLPADEPRTVTVLHSRSAVSFLHDCLPIDQPLSTLHSNLATKLSTPSLPPLDTLFVRVRLTLLGRGTPTDRAIIYAASEEEQTFWMTHMHSNQEDLKPDEDWETWALKTPGLSGEGVGEFVRDKFPREEAGVGYVTSGGFSLAMGKGMGVGCCTVKGLYDIFKAARKDGRKPANFVLIRNLNGHVCRPATFELLP